MFSGWLLAPAILLILLYSSLCANPNCYYAYKLPTGKVITRVFNPYVQLRQRKGSSLVRGYDDDRGNFVEAKRTVRISDGDILRRGDPLGFTPKGSKPSGRNTARSFSEGVGLTQTKWHNGRSTWRSVSRKKNTYLFLFRSDHSVSPSIGCSSRGGNSAISARPRKTVERSKAEEANPTEDQGGGNTESVTDAEVITPQGGKYKKRKYTEVRDEKKKGNLPNTHAERFTGVDPPLEKNEGKRGKGVTKLGSKLIRGEASDSKEAVRDDSMRRSTTQLRSNQRLKYEPLSTINPESVRSTYDEAIPASYYQRKGSEKEASYKDCQRESGGMHAYRYPLPNESHSKLRTPEGDTPSEDNVGKTLEGEVYSVSPNAVLVKIKNTDHFGMLFKSRCNFGDDVGDLNEYFKVEQKIFVKVLGINMKKKLYYLANIIKYNPDVKLKTGDTSKGLITKLCESYLFVKILKNGTTGYLHKSKLFPPSVPHMGEEKNKQQPQEGEPQKAEQHKGRHNHRWDVLLKMAQFTRLFNIWDIIDVEIYDRPDVNFKSNYILTIPEESKTFDKVLSYFDSLSGGIPHEGEVNHSGGETSVNQGGEEASLNEGKKDPFVNHLGGDPLEESSDGDAADHRKRRSRTSHSREAHHTDRTSHQHYTSPTHEEQRTCPPRGFPSLRKNKEALHKDRASAKFCRVPENASLSVFSKMTKISLSALKKFFIINESREYHSGHTLSADQMRKASEHFNVSCVVDVGEGSVAEGAKLESSIVDGGVVEDAVTPGVSPTRESDNEEEEVQTDGKAKPNGEIKLGLNNARVASKPRIACPTEDPTEKSKKRNIVVTFIGHINHGKTSLFDYICKTKERDKEKGLITQNIRAFKVKSKGNDFTFTLIDTPGHEAFMPIRSRGVKISDLSILVISGEEGIQEQTVECIKLIKEHHIRIVIAVTKMDLPNVSVDRIINDLLHHEIYTEMNGGDVQVVPCSILKAESMDKLVDAIYLESEFLDLPLEESKDCQGVILDSYIDKNGIVSINLVQNGTLRVNDYFYTGSSYGKVKIMKDHLNKKVKSACASDPVMVVGYEKNSVPVAGDRFYVVQNETVAEQIAQHHKNELLASQMRGFSYGQEDGNLDRYRDYIINEGSFTPDEEQKQNGEEANPNDGEPKQDGGEKNPQLEESTTQENSPQVEDTTGEPPPQGSNNEKEGANHFGENDPKTVYVSYFVKCDKQGTIDVLKNCLLKLEVKDTLHRVRNKIVYSSIGDITASDITYARSFDAIIIGFNVKLSKSCPKNTKQMLSSGKSSCRIIYVNVLYDLIDQVEDLMKEKLSSKPRGTYKGQATILKVFNVSKLGKVAGCVVNSGTVNNHSNVRILRNDQVIHIGKIVSLKIGKEEKEEVSQGDECGMGFENFVDFLPGDKVESYQE
ncbi:translation initiation factor IF-2 [Plasmodium inui San Antonio 1]|uniref:Translation initiation factor IF-2, chloroplastic n=1 Tax=Plasmodium inui San Antonio 1 TaxID=1237626 RepID=W7AS22_9APIC|nr:translation initiation factor IF-2 [Plasmodium inui San Antonio 1]EUD68286.1 translation initiation factor IF-2 [Plasmodium inui San Antonio 1]